MTWFTGGAIVITLLLIANAVLYRLRFRTLLRPQARSDLRGGRITKAGIAVYAIFVGALLVGAGVRELAPETDFGGLLHTWVGIGSYLVWCIFGATALGTLLTVCGLPSHERVQTSSAQDA
jgi:hypothetical protein